MEKIVIIGGGLGGLSVGALLAKDGYSVTLIEQHNIVGGCATVFKRKGGYTCEVGLHEMDGVYTSPSVKKTFEKLGVYKQIEFIRPDEFFKIYTKKSEFIMPEGKDEAKRALKERFSSEGDAIESYFKLLDDIALCYDRLSERKWYHMALFPFYFYPLLKYKNKNVNEVLDSITQNEELKLILNANVQYYNDSPSTLSFLLHGVAQSSYYKGGGYFIKGGSYKLSEYLCSIITENNGEVIVSGNVIKASKDNVTYKKKGKEVSLKADKIISNISPQDTYRLFNIEYKEEKLISNSISTIYFGFSKNLKSIYGKKPYSNFFFEDIGDQKDFEAILKDDVLKRGFVFVDYSQVDAALVDKGKSFGEVCIIDDLKDWDSLEKEEYKKKKKKLIENILERLENYYPNIKELVEYSEAATPKTMVRYLKTPSGTAYGYKPTPKQFFRIPKIKSDRVDNLYFTGQFVISGGFSPAVSSGFMCYEEIVKN